MGRPKKDKYIRDLFEENFSKKFSYFLCKITMYELYEKYNDSVNKTINLLEAGKKFVDAPTVYNKVIEDKELYTVKTFNQFLYEMNFRGQLYQLIDFKKLFNDIPDKNTFYQNIVIEIDKMLNKSIDNFIEKNKDLFVFCKPSRNSIAIITVENILDKVIDCALRELNPSYKKERIAPEIEQRNTFIHSEHKRIMNLIEVFKEFNENKEKYSKIREDYSIEDMLKYFVSQRLDVDWQDSDIDFIFQNYNELLMKKELSYKYLREKYNYSLNDETLDKIIDRGSEKRKKSDPLNITYKKIDYELHRANSNEGKERNDYLFLAKYDFDYKNKINAKILS